MEILLHNILNSMPSEYVWSILVSIKLLFIEFILFLFVLSIIPRLIIYSKARKDYRLSRGTQHLKQTKYFLQKLKKTFKNLKREAGAIQNSLNNLEKERSIKLIDALSRHLVETRLTEVQGIGPKLRDKIISQCFDGTLNSLKRAYVVYGVGNERSWGISNWVDSLKMEIPKLLKREFPNKIKIYKEFDDRKLELKDQLDKLENKIESMNKIKDVASAEVNRLSMIGVSHFRKSYQQNERASEAVNQYILGIFPEWGKMPLWFKELISEYGD